MRVIVFVLDCDPSLQKPYLAASFCGPRGPAWAKSGLELQTKSLVWERASELPFCCKRGHSAILGGLTHSFLPRARSSTARASNRSKRIRGFPYAGRSPHRLLKVYRAPPATRTRLGFSGR